MNQYQSVKTRFRTLDAATDEILRLECELAAKNASQSAAASTATAPRAQHAPVTIPRTPQKPPLVSPVPKLSDLSREESALEDQSPAERFAQKASALRQLPSDTDWQRLFLARATRRVRLDATVSLDGTLWEVPVHLRGRQVQLRYEPFQWSVLEVWYQDKLAGLGRRCDKQLNAKTYNTNDYER
jgi:hypothetical protein